MPVCTLFPKDAIQAEKLRTAIQSIRADVKRGLGELTGFPTNDILVRLAPPWLDADPDGADTDFVIATCPNAEVARVAARMNEKVREIMLAHGFSVRVGEPTEVWGPLFWDGPWTKLDGGRVVDSVTYPHDFKVFRERQSR